MKKNIVVTVSGGRSSAMMARHIQLSEKYKEFNKIYIFNNTGMERPETIQFLKDIEEFWQIPLIKLEAQFSFKKGIGVNYKIIDNYLDLDMNGVVFSNAIKEVSKGSFKGLPNTNAPYCSRYMKTDPTKKISDDVFGKNNYLIAMGFRREDMPRRISWAEIKVDEKRIFPLITDFENPISQFDLNEFWEKQPFKLGIHGDYGNCELCWKKSTPKLIKNIRFGTRFIDWYRKEEKKWGFNAFRNNLSIEDLIKLANDPSRQMEMFTDEENDDNCVCDFS